MADSKTSFRPGNRAPQALIDLVIRDPECLRQRGVSRQKNLYLRDLADHFVANKIPTRRFGSMSDEEIIESLTRVNGIGRWTAEMFLMFTLNRPDVWPVDDLGLRKGAQKLHALRKPPDLKKLIKLGEPFRPWRHHRHVVHVARASIKERRRGDHGERNSISFSVPPSPC